MKIEYINPFIESLQEFFSTMLESEAVRGKVGVTKTQVRPGEITALIGMSGPAQGSVAMGFPEKTALAVVNKLLGTDTAEVDDTVVDGMAEVVNIVAGGAKAKFPTGDGPPIDLSLPTVIRGEDFRIDHHSDTVWIQVPFGGELGEFNLRVTMKIDETKK